MIEEKLNRKYNIEKTNGMDSIRLAEGIKVFAKKGKDGVVRTQVYVGKRYSIVQTPVVLLFAGINMCITWRGARRAKRFGEQEDDGLTDDEKRLLDEFEELSDREYTPAILMMLNEKSISRIKNSG